MVCVNLGHVCVQCLGQFPLLSRAHQPVAGGDEHGRGQAQLTGPRLSVVATQRVSRVGEFARQPATELSGEPRPVGIELWSLLDCLAQDPFDDASAGTEPQTQLKQGQQPPDHPLAGCTVPLKRCGLHDKSLHPARVPLGQQQPDRAAHRVSDHDHVPGPQLVQHCGGVVGAVLEAERLG